MQTQIDITNINRDLLLQKLWESSTNKYNKYNLTFNFETAKREIKLSGYPDYICGRPIKTDIYNNNIIDPYLYDRENGDKKFEEVVELIKSESNKLYIPKGVPLEQTNAFHKNAKMLGCVDNKTMDEAMKIYNDLF